MANNAFKGVECYGRKCRLTNTFGVLHFIVEFGPIQVGFRHWPRAKTLHSRASATKSTNSNLCSIKNKKHISVGIRANITNSNKPS
jgi:hypothetical protein